MSDRPTLSVLVPAYNEAATIGVLLERLLAIDANLTQVVVVDDGSTDGTGEIVREIVRGDARVELLEQPNRGKTAAVAAALARATGEVILIQDADLEYDPDEIVHVLEPIQLGRADVVYGSRFLVRRAARVLYFHHYLANRLITFISNVLTNRNMTDIETCYKAFRAEVIKPIRFSSRGFGLEVELTALVCKTKARTYEVPISYHGRTYEEGKKITARDGLAALWYLLYYNLVAPHTAAGRLYIRTVNEALERTARG